jgi:hypothetical protein
LCLLTHKAIQCVLALTLVTLDNACPCSMVFSANDSPLAGRSGKAVTGRAIGTRLMQEAESSVSLKVTPLPGGTERYEVQVGSCCVRCLAEHDAPSRLQSATVLSVCSWADTYPHCTPSAGGSHVFVVLCLCHSCRRVVRCSWLWSLRASGGRAWSWQCHPLRWCTGEGACRTANLLSQLWYPRLSTCKESFLLCDCRFCIILQLCSISTSLLVVGCTLQG